MIVTPTRKLRAYLSGVVATTQPDYNCSWVDINTTTYVTNPDSVSGALNSTTPVEIVPVCSAGYKRQVRHVAIYNRDAAAVTVTIESNDGSARSIVRALLDPNCSLQWEPGGTWHVYDENGVVQTSAAGGGISYLVVREADLAPTVNATILEFDQSTGLTVSDMGSGRALVASAAGGGNPRRVPWMIGG